jgi:hypothetical protein
MPIVVERSLFLGSLNPRRGGNALAQGSSDRGKNLGIKLPMER